jgi:peptidoglycan/LPS O-acetylase OafA/YrhL
MIWFALDVEELGLEKKTAKLVATVIAFFGTLLIASITYRFMEKPLLNLKDRFFPLKTDKT